MKEGRLGFSIIELLFAMWIIFILSAISFLVMKNYKEKAIVSNVQQTLVNCAESLLTAYADSGESIKKCFVRSSKETCILCIDEKSGNIRIIPDKCVFTIQDIKVICTINTSYDSVNGFVTCYAE